MKTFILTILICLCASLASAQSTSFDRYTPPLPTQNERLAADIASWGTVGAAIVLDSVASWRSENRSRALYMQGARLAVTYGAATIIKEAVHRARPCAPECGMDSPNSSFYSLHTAFAFQALGGPGISVSIPLAVSSGGLRIAAGKHFLTDVLAGAAVGALTSRLR